MPLPPVAFGDQLYTGLRPRRPERRETMGAITRHPRTVRSVKGVAAPRDTEKAETREASQTAFRRLEEAEDVGPARANRSSKTTEPGLIRRAF
jgi:hypothetical protein